MTQYFLQKAICKFQNPSLSKRSIKCKTFHMEMKFYNETALGMHTNRVSGKR